MLPALRSFGLQLVKAARVDACADCSDASSGPDPDPDPAAWDCDLHLTVGARLSPEDGAGAGAVAIHMASAVAIAQGRVWARGSCVAPGARFVAENGARVHLTCKVAELHQQGLLWAQAVVAGKRRSMPLSVWNIPLKC